MADIVLYDTIRPRGLRKTDDGYLVGRARVARTGLQLYLGDEVGRPDMPVVRVYRPPEAVFDKASMATYAGKPLTDDHPPGGVNAATWKDKAVGQLGANVARDGEFIDVDLSLMDASMIKKVDAGKAELSAGYDATLVWEAGISDSGEEYDARVENLRINHVAVVDRARGGSSLRLGDSRNPEPEVPAQNPRKEDKYMETIMIDGVPVQVADAAAAATIRKALAERETKLTDAEKSAQAAKDAHDGAMAAKDAELKDAQTKLADAQKSVLTDAQIDERARARATLIDTAKKLHDSDYSGKTDAEIRSAVVAAKLGDAAIKDRSAEYISAAFDVLSSGTTNTTTQQTDAVRNAMKDAKPDDTRPVTYGNVLEPTPAQNDYRKRLADGWRGDTAK